MSIRLKMVGYAGIGLSAVIVATAIGRISYGCGVGSRDDEVADLSSRLAGSQETLEIREGLYTTQLVEVRDLRTLLDGSRVEISNLKDQLEKSKAELLSTQELAVRWKRAFEGALTVSQSDSGESPTSPGVVRKRVDFTGDLGPIAVTGHTLTDPPEGHVSVRQVRPLLLTVNVAKDRTGRWTSLVTSSEPDMDVSVRLGGVNPGVVRPIPWHQRFWMDVSAGLIGDPSASMGLAYRGDRFSVGASCLIAEETQGCGVTAGVRLGR